MKKSGFDNIAPAKANITNKKIQLAKVVDVLYMEDGSKKVIMNRHDYTPNALRRFDESKHALLISHKKKMNQR